VKYFQFSSYLFITFVYAKEQFVCTFYNNNIVFHNATDVPKLYINESSIKQLTEIVERCQNCILFLRTYFIIKRSQILVFLLHIFRGNMYYFHFFVLYLFSHIVVHVHVLVLFLLFVLSICIGLVIK
jgi:hypothetical protein